MIEFRGPDGPYIGLLIERGDTSNRYVVVPVTTINRDRLRAGSLDLLSCMVDAWAWYKTSVEERRVHFQLEEQDGDKVPREYLPDPGFKLRR